LPKVSIGKDGTPNIDKNFIKQANKDGVNKVVEAYSKRAVLRALLNNFVSSFIKILTQNKDGKADGRIRSSYNFLDIVSGRTASRNPNLQNLPEHAALSKPLKRSIIAPKGCIIIKIDYSAAEVRGIGNVSRDMVVRDSFMVAHEFKKQYLDSPTEGLKFDISKSDVHMVNASSFYNFDLNKVSNLDELKQYKPQRQDIKTIVFGLIYGRSAKAIASQLGKDIAYVEELIRSFFKKFKFMYIWLETTKETARKRLFVEGPTGLRRNLFGYLMPEKWKNSYQLKSALDRRAVNSIIQGYSSQTTYRGMNLFIDEVYHRYKDRKEFPMRIFNTVHDSVMFYCSYDHVLECIELIQYSFTDRVMQQMNTDFGIDFQIPIEIDFEIGASLGQMTKYDHKLSDLYEIVKQSVEFQQKELLYEVDAKDTIKSVFGVKGNKIPAMYKPQINNGFFDITILN
ncbi:MAG: DNA polymerase, partial [Verrucomicrobia bacterium]|nr:DNA polymerase [Verrucomicrobiota bacterium]